MAHRDRLEGPALFEHPISAAVIAAIFERGYQGASVEEFLQRSGITAAEFDRRFDGKRDATLRVFEAYIDDFVTRARTAFESSPDWPENLRATAYEVVRWIGRYPEAAWFGMVGVLEAGDMALVRREEVFKWCASLIDRGRAVAPDPEAVPRSAPLIAIGAIVEMLRRYEEGSLIADPIATVPELMYAAVRPYLGEEAARRELEIPPPPDLAAEEPG
jgi:AcrR family transcriptional regulator